MISYAGNQKDYINSEEKTMSTFMPKADEMQRTWYIIDAADKPLGRVAAEAAGVSRGTVDRALKDRGRVKPEVAEKIKKIAQEMGYQPSRAGRALAMAKRNIKIGVDRKSVV